MVIVYCRILAEVAGILTGLALAGKQPVAPVAARLSVAPVAPRAQSGRKLPLPEKEPEWRIGRRTGEAYPRSLLARARREGSACTLRDSEIPPSRSMIVT